MSRLSSPALNVDTMVNNGIEFIKQFPKIWNKIHPSDLRVLRNLFFPENVYYYYPTIKTPKTCCIYSTEPSFCDERYRYVTLERLNLKPYIELFTELDRIISHLEIPLNFEYSPEKSLALVFP